LADSVTGTFKERETIENGDCDGVGVVVAVVVPVGVTAIAAQESWYWVPDPEESCTEMKYVRFGPRYPTVLIKMNKATPEGPTFVAETTGTAALETGK
jgi:hypothetical protein